ncbi:hypothetical protein B0H14DRAFT_2268138, partial [Mycena olivaceomarginata]
QGLIVMYSITSGPSFNHAKDVCKMVTRAKRGKQVCVPGGNKCDKFQEREVAKAEGEMFAQRLGCDFMETSAKTALN